MAPCEIGLVFDGFLEDEKYKSKLVFVAAWKTAYLQRVKEFPELNKFLGEPTPEQAEEEIYSNLQAWSGYYKTKQG